MKQFKIALAGLLSASMIVSSAGMVFAEELDNESSVEEDVVINETDDVASSEASSAVETEEASMSAIVDGEDISLELMI